MKTNRIEISDGADNDLKRIQDFLLENEGPLRTEHVMSRLEAVIMRLEQTPARGVVPPELDALGHREFREVFYKPYRVFYRISEDKVEVVLVADGRRDMRALLQQRLLRSGPREGGG